MTGFHWLILFIVCFGALAYHRASLLVWTLSITILLLFFSRFSSAPSWDVVCTWAVFIFLLMPLNIFPLRRKLISSRILNFYRSVMPSISRTEKEALAAGSVTWEGDLFRGAPNWEKFLAFPKAQLTADEQAFIDGPVDILCGMLNDWEITHQRADLPPEVWQYIREQGFFGLIIPKEYGGKAFSAYAHSQILTKIYAVSGTAASTVSVPNSLGPAELLLHYGTTEQKDYYLPRLAKGDEIPCFALTGPEAGSDAGSIPDTGVVCWGEHEGKKVLGIRLNFNKRYITLAPVATVIGLAFKLFDPDHLIGSKTKYGITCALIPRDTKGISIGRRHFPLNIVFQNGPIHGKDVFIPVEWIIGGVEMAGQGWRMLMECLAAGRAISLPASSTGGSKMLAFATGAYARIRRQFNTAIGRFEGVEEVLTRIACHTYMIDAARTFAAVTIDIGEKPAIASAIVKYHATELGRKVANDAMDIHGGKGICLGPKNYLARGYESVPISITVEGANILTRNMIIFGQGAMRCHPYILAELVAAKISVQEESLNAFDKTIFSHMGYTLSNVVRAFITSITGGRFVKAPKGVMKKYFKQVTRFSAAFALMADVSLIILGGALKRKESISARLGDILSYLYLLSTVLKHYHSDGEPLDDLPIVEWSCQTLLFQIQTTIGEILQNFPNRWVAMILRVLIFPLGQHFKKPQDDLSHKISQLLLSPTETRARLTAGIFLSPVDTNILTNIEDALGKVITAEPIEKAIRNAVRDDLIHGDTLAEQAKAALTKHVISREEYRLWQQADQARQIVIAVDDFAPEELSRN